MERSEVRSMQSAAEEGMPMNRPPMPSYMRPGTSAPYSRDVSVSGNRPAYPMLTMPSYQGNIGMQRQPSRNYPGYPGAPAYDGVVRENSILEG